MTAAALLNSDMARPLPIVFFGLWALLAVFGFAFFWLGGNGRRKRAWFAPFVILAGIAFLAFVFVVSNRVAEVCIAVPFVLVFLLVNIRTTKFCPRCGAMHISPRLSGPGGLCRRCRAPLDERGGGDPREEPPSGKRAGTGLEGLEDPPPGLRAEEPRPGVVRLVLPRSGFRWQAWLFIPFLVFFMGMVGWMTVRQCRDEDFSPAMLIFMMPFWIVPLLMLFFVIRTWFAANAVEFEGGSIFLCVRMPLLAESRRELALSELESVSVDSNMGAGMWNFLVIKTAGRKLRFGSGVDCAVLDWLAGRIRDAKERAG
jgi:hypothetical protein